MHIISIKNLVVYYIVSVNVIYVTLCVIYPDIFFGKYAYVNLYSYAFSNIYGLILISVYREYDGRLAPSFLLYILFFTFANKSLYYHYTDSFFAFSADDSIDYHLLAEKISGLPYFGSLKSLSYSYGLDDWGFPFVLSNLYRVVQSPFILTILNICLIYLCFQMLRYIGSKFLEKKDADFAALAFACSQYAIFYVSTGLKEVIMITILIGSYYFYFKYKELRSVKYLFISVVIISLLFFFRVPLLFFVLFSIVINEVLLRRKKIKYFILICSLLLGIVFFWYMSDFLVRYYGILGMLDIIHSSRFSGSIYFVFPIALLSGLLGPFPSFTLLESGLNQSLYAGSLLLKMFLSFFFFVGAYKIFKHRNKYIIPLLVFTLLEIFSLVAILDSFELRKSMPHLAFVIMISVYAMNFFTVKKKYLKTLITFALITVGIVYVVLWNSLRL